MGKLVEVELKALLEAHSLSRFGHVGRELVEVELQPKYFLFYSRYKRSIVGASQAMMPNPAPSIPSAAAI